LLPQNNERAIKHHPTAKSPKFAPQQAITTWKTEQWINQKHIQTTLFIKQKLAIAQKNNHYF